MVDVTIKNLPEPPDGWEYTGTMGWTLDGEMAAKHLIKSGEYHMLLPGIGHREYGALLRRKPKKIIDMISFVSSGSDYNTDVEVFFAGYWEICSPSDVDYEEGFIVAFNGKNHVSQKCRIRQGVKFVGEGEKKVPDGLRVRFMTALGRTCDGDSELISWPGVRWYEVIGSSEHWRYDWEKEE